MVVDVFLKVIGEDLEISFATENKPWRIASKCLYDRATEKAACMGVNTSRKWPKTPQDFIRKLNESKDTIVYKGWNYERYHVENERGIDLWRITNPSNNSKKNLSEISTTNQSKPDTTDTDDTDYTCLDTVRKNEKEENSKSKYVLNTGKEITVNHILPSEPCHGRQTFAVETIITLPNQPKPFRFCKSCSERLITLFSNNPIIHKNGEPDNGT